MDDPYRAAGVDIDAGNKLVDAIKPLAAATARPGADADLGGFGGLFDLKAAGFKDPLLVAATDGVGTKLRLAIDTGRHNTIGIDLVAMCVNDLLAQGAEPLLFLDYYATGRLEVAIARSVVAGIAEGCREAGCALIGGETAEMPGHYAGTDYDLAGFTVGAVERHAVLPRKGDISPGDVLVALPSSGFHSNGYSLVRKVVADQSLSWDQPAPFAADLPLGTELLAPTRIYVRSVKKALRATSGIRAIAHITGGGLTENIPRVLPGNVAAEIEGGRWAPHRVFPWIMQAGAIDSPAMLRTFNCGIGMVLVVEASEEATTVEALSAAGERPVTIGRIVARPEASTGVIYREPEAIWSTRP